VRLTAARPRIEISADGTGIICQAGRVLLQALRVTGLDRGLSRALGRWRGCLRAQRGHRPGGLGWVAAGEESGRDGAGGAGCPVPGDPVDDGRGQRGGGVGAGAPSTGLSS